MIVGMLTVLASYNITVEELKAIFHKLKGVEQKWVCTHTLVSTLHKCKLIVVQ